MSELSFLLVLSLVFSGLFAWGFKFLPGERWQMLAVVPLHKHHDNSWHGLNITYYGFFVATSQLFGVILLLILLGSLSISLAGTLAAVLLLLLVCLPAARVIARIVEKKQHTFTIGGAAFIGIILSPWAIGLSASSLSALGIGIYMPILPTLAAMSICYTLGEGLGRLGCISYGCCYGKPLCEFSSAVQKVFRGRSFTFTGDTKKAVYEGQFGGQSLVPIQAITAVIYAVTTIVATALFLHGAFTAALLISIVISQGWRIASETLRADFRGFSKISAYQKMGAAAILYVAILPFVLPGEALPVPNLAEGIGQLWSPGLILGLQLMWLLFFYVFGKSSVTTSEVSFEILHEHV